MHNPVIKAHIPDADSKRESTSFTAVYLDKLPTYLHFPFLTYGRDTLNYSVASQLKTILK